METVKVFVRFRANEKGDLASWELTSESVSLENDPHIYTFDQVFPPDSSQLATERIQRDDFRLWAKCEFFIQGSGKTFTMLGPEEVTTELVNSPDIQISAFHGVIPRAISDLFQRLETLTLEKMTIKCSYTEIYNESVNDLLASPPTRNLRIREFPRLGMCIIGAIERDATCPKDVLDCLALGTVSRITGATEMNQRSSRSHTIFTLTIDQQYQDGSTKSAKLNLVDLAGSEKVSKTGACGQQLIEAQNINLSLTTLGRCIKALAGSKDDHVPYRESKLTMILKEALGGNAKTALICTVSMRNLHIEETLSTLKFAERAKKIQVRAKSNVSLSQQELVLLVTKLKNEVNSLRKQLLDQEKPFEIEETRKKEQDFDLGKPLESDLETWNHDTEQILEISGQLKDHMDRMEEANQVMADLYRENGDLRTEHETYVSETKSQIQTLLTEIKDSKTRLEKANVDIEALNGKLREKDGFCRENESRVALLEGKLKNAMETNKELERAIYEKVQYALSLETEKISLKRSLEVLQSNENRLNSVLGKLHQNLSNFPYFLEGKHPFKPENSVSSLESIIRLISDLTDLIESKDAEIRFISEAKTRLSQDSLYREAELEVRLTLAKAEIKSFNKAMSEIAISEGGKIEFWKPVGINIKPVIAKLMQEMKNLQKDYKDMVEGFQQEVRRIKDFGEENRREVERRLTDVSVLLDQERAINLAKTQALKFAEVEEASLRFHLKQLKAETAQMTQYLDQEKTGKEKMQREIEELKSEIGVLNAEISKKNEGFESKIRVWKVTEQNLSAEIDDLKLKLRKASTESSILRDLVETKEEEMRSSSSLMLNLESKLTSFTLHSQKLDSAMKYFHQRQHSSIPCIGYRTGSNGLFSSPYPSLSQFEDSSQVSRSNSKETIRLVDVRALYSNAEDSDGEVGPTNISSLDHSELQAEEMLD